MIPLRGERFAGRGYGGGDGPIGRRDLRFSGEGGDDEWPRSDVSYLGAAGTAALLHCCTCGVGHHALR